LRTTRRQALTEFGPLVLEHARQVAALGRGSRAGLAVVRASRSIVNVAIGLRRR
jgi:DNA-binding transcriptional LysR family regulator